MGNFRYRLLDISIIAAHSTVGTPLSTGILTSKSHSDVACWQCSIKRCNGNEIYDTVLCRDIRSEDWDADTRDSNSDKDGDHACGDLCAGIVLVICKNEKAIYCEIEGIKSFKV